MFAACPSRTAADRTAIQCSSVCVPGDHPRFSLWLRRLDRLHGVLEYNRLALHHIWRLVHSTIRSNAKRRAPLGMVTFRRSRRTPNVMQHITSGRGPLDLSLRAHHRRTIRRSGPQSHLNRGQVVDLHFRVGLVAVLAPSPGAGDRVA